jgi:hypothetical protein
MGVMNSRQHQWVICLPVGQVHEFAGVCSDPVDNSGYSLLRHGVVGAHSDSANECLERSKNTREGNVSSCFTSMMFCAASFAFAAAFGSGRCGNVYYEQHV